MLRINLFVAGLFLACVSAGWCAGPATATAPAPGVVVTLSGGLDTDPVDHGRPVVLVAAGLGVPTGVFREVFTHVKPAPGGQEPDPRQVQLNKRALLDGLAKYHVTNERLDEVSNAYRYPPGDGNLWKHASAVVKATLVNGKVTGFVIEKAGAGYTTPPQVSVPGFPKLATKVTLYFGTDLTKNGSIESIKVVEPAATQPATTRP